MILDAFHGAGGWAEGLRALGRSGLGVEYDSDMVATARAAGHECVLADVASVDPRELLDGERCEGLIASPPCPSFSAAGKQLGRMDLPAIHRLIAELHCGIDNRAATPMHDERSRLTVEPMRWVYLLQPEWIALEQVPAVLPVWQDMADRLREMGYSAWTGIVHAERYGVPQTRQRAVLLASRVRDVGESPATNRRYYPPNHKLAGKPPDVHLPRWVSMAEALGWSDEDRVGFPRRNDREDGHAYRVRDTRLGSEPAFGMTEKARSWQRWVYRRPATTVSGDPRVSGPGHKDGRPGSGYPRQQDNAIRVSIEEAAILQSFRPGYPWHGTRTKQFVQVSNAIPVRLAEALLREVIGVPVHGHLNLAAFGL